MRATLGEVGRRCQAGKRAEVVDKVRLIVVAAGHGNLRPCRPLAVRKSAQRRVKAAYAAIRLRRQADGLAEHLDEAPWAEADAAYYFRDCSSVRQGVKFSQREGDGWMRRFPAC